jgi:cytochrome c-type biogenesis protein
LLQQEVSYAAAFAAGLLSFLTPCVLPLVPGYLSFISGVSLADLQEREEADRWRKLLPVITCTLAFVLGFSLVFIGIGITAHKLIALAPSYKEALIRVGGVVVIVLGLHMAGAFKIQALYREKRFEGGKGGSLPRAFLLGVAFSFGWTPCVGPILGGILGLAAYQDKTGQALLLMILYSAGMALPFFIAGIAVDSFFKAFDRIKEHFRKIEIGAGVLLVTVGFMMVINRFDDLKKIFIWILPDQVNLWG